MRNAKLQDTEFGILDYTKLFYAMLKIANCMKQVDHSIQLGKIIRGKTNNLENYLLYAVDAVLVNIHAPLILFFAD